MRLLFSLLFISLVAVACTTKKTEEKTALLSTYNNTEPAEWNSNSIKKSTDAHSGMNVATIDSATIYSLGYEKQIENISKTPISKAVFSYWIMLKNNKAVAKTVLSIDDTVSKKNIVWVGNPVKEKVKELNKWTQIEETFQIPKNVTPKHILKLYVLNDSKEEILLDDFKIDFY